MTQIVLDGAQVMSFVSQRVATSVAKHMRMDLAQSTPLASPPDKVIHVLAPIPVNEFIKLPPGEGFATHPPGF
jgi:hypothetical protein